MKTIKLNILLLLIFLLNSSFDASIRHPLHVSTTEINYNAKGKSLEVSTRIFTDDFEAILSKNSNVKVDLLKPSMQGTMDILISKYIAARLKISVDGKTKIANYIGYEKDHEATMVYTEITDVPAFRTISVSNAILYDLFDDQMNILHLMKAGSRKSGRVIYPEQTLSLTVRE